jgi:hypothetical protein
MGDVALAKQMYQATRGVWFASGPLDAQERLSLLPLASGMRSFAFLTHAPAKTLRDIAAILDGFQIPTCRRGVRFDIPLQSSKANAPAFVAYHAYKRQHDRLYGLAAWLGDSHRRDITITTLGKLLSYPQCCVEADLDTRTRDHKLFIEGLIREVGRDPSQIAGALRRRISVEKASTAHLRRVARRFDATMRKYPYALHIACD